MASSENAIQVLVAADFSQEQLDRIRAVSPRLNVLHYFPDVPDDVWATVEVLYTVRSFPAPEQAPMLRWIQLNSAGMERALRHPIMQSEDVIVTSTSGIHATQMANFAMMMLLAFHYQLPQMIDFQRAGRWDKKAHEIFKPTILAEQTVGIVGYGSIGREIARLAHAFGLTVLASKRDAKRAAEKATDYSTGTGDPEGSIPERIYPGEALRSMAADCDYLIVTLPATPQTQHIINEELLKVMKDTAVLINVGRGAVVDEEALVKALKKKQIRGAALDVFEEEPLPFDSPLWRMNNVIISPHVSGNLSAYAERAVDLFIANLERYLERKPLYNALDREAGY